MDHVAERLEEQQILLLLTWRLNSSSCSIHRYSAKGSSWVLSVSRWSSGPLGGELGGGTAAAAVVVSLGSFMAIPFTLPSPGPQWVDRWMDGCDVTL